MRGCWGRENKICGGDDVGVGVWVCMGVRGCAGVWGGGGGGGVTANKWL